jgi:AbrB family transcriptional regulator (stage V sporulation protein T)
VDNDHIIAVSGGSKKDFMEKQISDGLEKVLKKRNIHIAKRNDSEFVPITNDDKEDAYKHELISPIISDGDVMGAVVLF